MSFVSAYLMRNRGLKRAVHGQCFTYEELAQGLRGSGAQGLMGFARIRDFPGMGEHWAFLEEASGLVLRCLLLYSASDVDKIGFLCLPGLPAA